MSHLLPKIIKYKGKLFREAGFSYGDFKGYRNDNERILVDPIGKVRAHYIMQDNQVRGF